MIFGNIRPQEVNKSLFYAYEKEKKMSARTEEVSPLVTASIDKQNNFVDVVHEYNIVKQMLINNSLPVSAGKLDSNSTSIFSRKLIIDKKILYSMLIDLQRFRKLLNLKKSFYIFHRNYDGKPAEMAKWHEKVEVRVTQTFRQLNIRRVIDIIGYDPSSYFKGEMSF